MAGQSTTCSAAGAKQADAPQGAGDCVIGPKWFLVPLCSLAFTVAQIRAATVILNQNTVVDASSPVSGFHVQVIDGISGPSTVEIATGGSADGFDVQQTSGIILSGGAVTYLSTLKDNATFVQTGGLLGCTDSLCQLIDYDADLTASGGSKLSFYGGSQTGVIRLNDSSTANFYGHDLALALFNQQFAWVSGTYINGDPVHVSIHYRPDIASVVILHEVPEPRGIFQSIATVIVLLFGFRSQQRSRVSCILAARETRNCA